ncbi:hypothetical protein QBC45DRAFT_432255 [Copromyces sp. CBS 386.78]|nr:hypothetical protein QBC45DRAFT_432255 [Copromyces sp. CBS 386.78]
MRRANDTRPIRNDYKYSDDLVSDGSEDTASQDGDLYDEVDVGRGKAKAYKTSREAETTPWQSLSVYERDSNRATLNQAPPGYANGISPADNPQSAYGLGMFRKDHGNSIQGDAYFQNPSSGGFTDKFDMDAFVMGTQQASSGEVNHNFTGGSFVHLQGADQDLKLRSVAQYASNSKKFIWHKNLQVDPAAKSLYNNATSTILAYWATERNFNDELFGDGFIDDHATGTSGSKRKWDETGEEGREGEQSPSKRFR